MEIYTGDSAVVDEFATQFSTRNLEVTERSAPSWYPAEFIVIRDASGAFEGALGIDHLQSIISPNVDSADALFETEPREASLFDFLDEAVFVTDDRRQILAATREIEDRARRAGRGNLYVGFQRMDAFRDQRPLYERFVRETDVTTHVFIGDPWTGDRPDGLQIVDEAPGEIGDYWIVLFDGGDHPIDACGLLAHEREAGYSGFWTYDQELVAELIEYIETQYLD